MVKSIWQSKTVWANVALALAAVLAEPTVVGVLPPAALPYIAALAAVLNIILRLNTSGEVAVVTPGTAQKMNARRGLTPPARKYDQGNGY